jgi:hypothetical protein
MKTKTRRKEGEDKKMEKTRSWRRTILETTNKWWDRSTGRKCGRIFAAVGSDKSMENKDNFLRVIFDQLS